MHKILIRPGHQNLICYRLFLTSFSFLTMSASIVEIRLSRSVLRARTVASCSLAEVSRGSLGELCSMFLIPSSRSDTALRVYKTKQSSPLLSKLLYIMMLSHFGFQNMYLT